MVAEVQTTSLVEDVRRVFELASLKQEAARHLRAAEWREFQTITASHAERRQAVEEIFASTYDERLATARQRLIEEAGSKRLELVPRTLGRDRFDHKAIDRQAHVEVRQAYRSSIEHIDREEARQIQALLTRAEQKNEVRQVALRDFAHAADRRGGPDRRRN